ncbi:MAG: HipA domain-containing protein [Akkermansia sp.]
MQKCLYCYQELNPGQSDFHPRCSKKIFSSTTVPLLPYTKANLAQLAQQIIRAQTTLTGVQAKISLDIDRSHNQPQRLTIVGLWGRYILKPPTERFRCLPEVEDLTMHLAELAGIKVVPHSLIRFSDGELCYLTKRIDRGANGEKYPMEDMCQISERLTEYKYNGSYQQIAKLIAKYSSVPKLDVINFWEQVVFSWITGNADMHLKNFSLFSPNKDSYSLTPGYDMLSTALVMPEDQDELALTLNGKKRKITRSDFEIAMLQTGLENKIITNIFAKLIKVADKWVDWIHLSFLPEEMKAQYQTILQAKIEKIQ